MTKCCISCVTLAKYRGGSGWEDDPYQIASKEDLLCLSTNTADYNMCFELTADIDLSEII